MRKHIKRKKAICGDTCHKEEGLDGIMCERNEDVEIMHGCHGNTGSGMNIYKYLKNSRSENVDKTNRCGTM